MEKQSKIFVAGHLGLVGSAILRKLRAEGYDNIIVRPRNVLDLTDQHAVNIFFESEKPEYVFLAAAKVGGIVANSSYPGDFIYENLALSTNTIHAAYKSGVKKFMFLGSSCVYPKLAPQPIKEEYLLSGPLEPTNDAYAVSKIAGIKMIQAYRSQYNFKGISLMPTNLYGPGDNYDLETSHVLPALIRKFHEAKINNASEVVIWGTGKPHREFLYIDDFADAALLLMKKYDSDDIINVGTGKDISIGELADIVRDVVGFSGEIVYDSSKPDGTPRKLLDISRLKDLGWEPATNLRQGISKSYQSYLSK
ncbi:MAG: GDP-L-fucose synthase [Candidatus Latescibacteria bacterium]|jgi:GDP-L-fucose synthase|nr:GDP-L-fucose synthase [Candidatus Latescibacterota bacterium]